MNDVNSVVEQLVARHPEEKALIPVLQKIQGELGYLPAPALEAVARTLKIPLSRVYGVATFYAQFRLIKSGEHLVQVCCGTACHVRGAVGIKEALVREFGQNGRVSLEEVRCVGCCSLAPVMVVDGKTFGRLDPKKAVAIVKGVL
ncbi:MAG: NAD(P)H-dependent oxidoreductase subunit E [Candidatus Bipolaricaulaceae bacterium]